MSWNPFRRSTKIEKRAISTTEERDFEREVRRIQQLEENVRKLYKDMKKYENALEAASGSECSLTQQLCGSDMFRSNHVPEQPAEKSTVWHLDEPTAMSKADQRVPGDVNKVKFEKGEECAGDLRTYAEHWHRASQKQDMQQKVLGFNSHKGVTEPMKKFAGNIPAVYGAIKKREKSLQTYNESQAKVDKYQDKDRTGANVVKLDLAKKGLIRTKDDYERQNRHLMRLMPNVYDFRKDYFKPSMGVLVKSQAQYYNELLKIHNDMAKESGGMVNSEQIHHRTQDTLKQIKALTIVADD